MDDFVYQAKVETNSLIALADKLFLEKSPFNALVGMRVDQFGENPLKLRVTLDESLIGNYARKMLHGGVSMSMMDAVGAMQVYRSIFNHRGAGSPDLAKSIVSKISTVSLTVQFLSPGVGESFYATAIVNRLGRKLAFVDMQLKNSDDKLIATGSGVYYVN